MSEDFGLAVVHKKNRRIYTTNDIYRYSEAPVNGQNKHLQFGHYTNGVVRLYRFYSQNGANLFGINNPTRKIVVLAQFFSLYDRNWDIAENNIYDPMINYTTDYLGKATFHPTGVNPNGFTDRWGQNFRPTFEIGYQTHLLKKEFKHCLSELDIRTLKQSIASGLEKYFGSQLIHCFLIGTGLFGDDLAIRVYWDEFSLMLLKTMDGPLKFTLTFRSILMFFIREENNKIMEKWNELIEVLTREFPADSHGININFVERVNIVSEMNEKGLPIHPNVKDIEITFNNTAAAGQKIEDARLAAFVKLYQLFTCYVPERLDNRNKYMEFYSYQFTHEDYLTNYKANIQSRQHGKPNVLSSFYYTNNQGYIGQAFRYIALSQTNYRLTLPGVAEYDITSPEIIHIRDAHHGCPTVFERALMDTFENSGKRYFFTTGFDYQRAWHTIYVPRLWNVYGFDINENVEVTPSDPEERDSATQYIAYTFEESTLGNGKQSNKSRSCWAGLQSFRKLPHDQCAFGNQDIFRKTMGIIFHHHEIPPRVRNILYGIMTNPTDFKNRYLSNLHYFSYGIDERLLANCFYPILHLTFNDRGQYESCRKLTATELGWAQTYRTNNTRIAACNLDVLNEIFTNMFYYVYDLDYRAIGMNHLLENNKKRIEGATVTNMYETTDVTTLIHPNINKNRNIIYKLLYEIYAYVITHKSFPKTQYDLIKNTEAFRNKTVNAALAPIHKLPSIYRGGNTIFRSYNQQWWTIDNLEVKYNQIFKTPSVLMINNLIQFITNLRRTNLAVYNSINSDTYANYINNYKTINKDSSCTGTLADYIERRRDTCMSQPLNYIYEPYARPGKSPGWPGYKYRGKSRIPSEGIPTAMVGGARRNSKKLKRLYQMGGENASAPNNSSKHLNFKVNISKLKSNFATYPKTPSEKTTSETSNNMTSSTKVLLNLLAYKNVLTTEEIIRDKPIAVKVLASCVANPSNIDKIMEVARSIFPYEESSHDDLYYDPPVNATICHNISSFLEQFKVYISEYDQSSAGINYFDIYFNLDTKPSVVHFSTALDAYSAKVYNEINKDTTSTTPPVSVFKNQTVESKPVEGKTIETKLKFTTKQTNKMNSTRNKRIINKHVNTPFGKTFKNPLRRNYTTMANSPGFSLPQPQAMAAF